jgi:predicted nuclease of predicted toxin-antitoxin system
MIFWIDAQITPALAPWLIQRFNVAAVALRDLGLRDATDQQIFDAARHVTEPVVVITKDRDFSELVIRYGVPPQVLWLTCGNTSNQRLQIIFEQLFLQAYALLEMGDPIVEVTDLQL